MGAKPLVVAAGTAFIVLALVRTAFAQAPALSIRPSVIELSPSHPTEMLRLRNDGGEASRYQVSAYTWEQTPDGQQVLHPTEDLVFFPPLFSVGAGEQQILRVAAAVPFGLKEQSYRLSIEQLPALAKPTGPRGGAQIRLLVKLSLPVFIEPANVVDGSGLDATGVEGGALSFTLKNTGNVHLVAYGLHVRGLGSDGRTVLERFARPSYVQADSLLKFALPIPPKDCSRLRTISISITTEQLAPGRDSDTKRAELTKEIKLGAESCSATGKGGDITAAARPPS